VNSDFVAGLLAHLHAIGVSGAPRHLGGNDQGRDILTFLPGQTACHPADIDPAAFVARGRMLRALHDATAGHPLARGRECVTHGDRGLYNTVFEAGMPIAFIDWDSAGPQRGCRTSP